MFADIKRTKQFYQTFEPCSCEDCRRFIGQFSAKYADVADYFRSLGVDANKPFELICFDGEYICMYAVVGEAERGFSKKIGDITITVAEHHPATGIKEKHFVLEFDGISF